MRGNCRDAGGNNEGYVFKPTQFVHQRIYLSGTGSLGVKDRLSVVEDNEHVFGGEEGTQECQVLGVFDPCTDDLGESGEEMRARSGKLIAADESTVLAESFLNPTVVENSEGNGCFPDPARADESDGFEVPSSSDDFFNQITPPKTAPQRRGR